MIPHPAHERDLILFVRCVLALLSGVVIGAGLWFAINGF